VVVVVTVVMVVVVFVVVTPARSAAWTGGSELSEFMVVACAAVDLGREYVPAAMSRQSRFRTVWLSVMSRSG